LAVEVVEDVEPFLEQVLLALVVLVVVVLVIIPQPLKAVEQELLIKVLLED
jgi:hypothetical protein